MQQLAVLALGIAVVALCVTPRSWNAFKAFGDRMTSFEAKVPTQLFARNLTEDEDLRETWNKFVRAVFVVIGACMVIGSLTFIAQHGLGSG